MTSSTRLPLPLRRLLSFTPAAGLILLLVSVHCAFSQPMEKPTSQDRTLADSYSALVNEFLAADSPARELINERDPERIQATLATLNSKVEVDPWELRRARRYVHRIMSQLEELKTFTPPVPYAVSQNQSPLTLDGNLTEADWQTAPVMPIHYHRLERVEGKPATVRLLWDKTYLYAAFDVPDTNIIAPQLKRDGEVWTTDCIELFLVPDLKARDYWEIEINASGSIYDGLCHKYTDRWGSKMQVEKSMEGLQFAINVRGTMNQTNDIDEGYTVEIAIPLKELPNFPQNPAIGDRIYALLCRVDRTSPDRNASAKPMAQVPWVSWFHNIWVYQPLVLSAPPKQ